MLDPNQDGLTHINVYSKGKTAIGQFLSNFAYAPIDLEDDGYFDSIEAYWYWLGTNHIERDTLRYTHGFEAKKLGRALSANDWHEKDVDFVNKIKAAITAKLIKYPKVVEALKKANLPLKHYYVYGGVKTVEPEEGRWVLEHIENHKNIEG